MIIFNQVPDFFYTAFLEEAVREVAIYKLTPETFVVTTADWNGGTLILDKHTNESVPDTENFQTLYLSPEEVYTLMFSHFQNAKEITNIEPKTRKLLYTGIIQTYTTPVVVNGKPVFVSQDKTTGNCLVLLGEQFVTHMKVQDQLDSLRTQEAPF